MTPHREALQRFHAPLSPPHQRAESHPLSSGLSRVSPLRGRVGRQVRPAHAPSAAPCRAPARPAPPPHSRQLLICSRSSQLCLSQKRQTAETLQPSSSFMQKPRRLARSTRERVPFHPTLGLLLRGCGCRGRWLPGALLSLLTAAGPVRAASPHPRLLAVVHFHRAFVFF